MSKSNVKVLKGLTPEAIVAMSDAVSAPIQEVVIKSTIDYKNMSLEDKRAKNKPDDAQWQGFMIQFDNTDQGPRLVPISASKLLSIQLDTGVSIFKETDKGHELIEPVRMGITNGVPTFEGAE